ncbi:MAG: alpha/beta hydrolase [Chitinophagaceae bacterium]|nr:MAG: alpha/beta hydrolase [Chitinophagaceae bacterium]
MKNILVLLSGLLLISCNNEPKQQAAATIATTKPVIENNGVRIVYNDSGKGDTALLFLHGWGINRSYWDEQVQHFSDRYRVVTLDLPGFGESGKNRTDWSVENYGKDINLVIDSLKLKNVILIGHSMSGALIVETARQNPSAIAGIIGIDNFKNYGGKMSEADRKSMEDAYKELRVNFKGVLEVFAQQLFAESTPKQVKDRVLHDATSGDTVIAVNIMEKNDGYALDSNLKALHKKLYLVNSDYNKNDSASFTRNNIPYRLLTIHATGHYPMLEKPAEFDQLLTQAIHEISMDK